MERIEILRKIFDDKIVNIINNLLDNPDKEFSLTEIASLSKTNISTTLRILDKLIKQDVIELILTGKSKFYKLKNSDKTRMLNKILKRDDHIQEFIEKLKRDYRIKRIILETKDENSAKLLIVGNFLLKEKINDIADEIKNKYNFKIQFVEISEKQFSDMSNIGLYNLNRKIIWERN